MPRFSLMRMLVSMTTFAIGMATIVYLFRCNWLSDEEDLGKAAAFWIAGGTFIGAGMLTPFKRTFLGAALGFGVQVIFIYLESIFH